MALKYTTIEKINAYLGTSGVDDLLEEIAGASEAFFDDLVWDGIESKTHTDIFPVWYYSHNPCKEGRVFYLKAVNPTSVTSVNGTSAGVLDTNYTLDGILLEFANTWNYPTTFPYRYKIVYVAGYTEIPADVTQIINMMTGAIYNKRNTEGISSFKQDLLTVNYKDGNALDTILDPTDKGIFLAVVNKYKVHTVLS